MMATYHLAGHIDVSGEDAAGYPYSWDIGDHDSDQGEWSDPVDQLLARNGYRRTSEWKITKSGDAVAEVTSQEGGTPK